MRTFNGPPFLRFAASCLMAMFCVVSVDAQEVVQTTTSEAAASAQLIVRAKVLDVQVRDEGWIQTYVDLQPLELVKGQAPGTITVRMFGGRIGNKETSGGDPLPQFKAGEEVIVFLQTSGQPYAAVDWHHVYRVATLPSGARVIQPTPSGLRSAAQDVVSPGMRVEDFLAALKKVQ